MKKLCFENKAVVANLDQFKDEEGNMQDSLALFLDADDAVKAIFSKGYNVKAYGRYDGHEYDGHGLPYINLRTCSKKVKESKDYLSDVLTELPEELKGNGVTVVKRIIVTVVPYRLPSVDLEIKVLYVTEIEL